jgi:hypothetical protein
MPSFDFSIEQPPSVSEAPTVPKPPGGYAVLEGFQLMRGDQLLGCSQSGFCASCKRVHRSHGAGVESNLRSCGRSRGGASRSTVNRFQVASSSANVRRSSRTDSASRQAVSSMKSERFLPRTAAASSIRSRCRCRARMLIVTSRGMRFRHREGVASSLEPFGCACCVFTIVYTTSTQIDPRRQRLKLAATAIFEE